MIAEAYISKQLKLLSASEFDEINSVLRKIYPPLKISIDALDELNMLLKNDKKTVHGELNFTLLQKIGEAVYNIKVSPALVDEAFAFILS
jgi:3-dehydroquinate synthase